MDGARMKRSKAGSVCLLAALLGAFPAPLQAGEGPAANEVPEEVWDRPRSGRGLLAVPAVQQALAALAAAADARLLIRHAAGAEPAAQAEELKAWLVAHGLGPERIALRADRAPRQPLRLDVTAAAQQ
jgi:hypothetical protein